MLQTGYAATILACSDWHGRARANHYMPESVLRSQFKALERPDSAICVSVEVTTAEQVEAALSSLAIEPPN